MQNRINSNAIQKILVITLTNLGDVILTTPVMSVLAEQFPNAKISVLVSERAQDILKRSASIDQIFLYDKNASLWKRFQLAMRLRSQGFDLVIDLRHTLFPLFIGAKYNTRMFRSRLHQLMREQHLDRLREMGLEISHIPSFNFFNADDLRSAQQKAGLQTGESYIVIVPGARYPLKSWDADRFGEVAKRIQSLWHKKIVLLGSEAESKVAQIVQNASSVINVCGKLSISESAAIVSGSEMVLTNDSALMHLAHALNVPCVSLFGPTSRDKYGLTNGISRVIQKKLPCVPCEKAVCQIEQTRKCMTDITVDDVLNEMKSVLQVGHVA